MPQDPPDLLAEPADLAAPQLDLVLLAADGRKSGDEHCAGHLQRSPRRNAT
jgi:hypothetical protein